MLHRVANVLLILALTAAAETLALTAAAETAPFMHARVNQRRTPRQRMLVGGARGYVIAAAHRYGHAPGTNILVGDRHCHLSVAQLDDPVTRPTVGVGATPALVEIWAARIVPDLPGRAVLVAANARLNRPPHVVLAARGPPV